MPTKKPAQKAPVKKTTKAPAKKVVAKKSSTSPAKKVTAKKVAAKKVAAKVPAKKVAAKAPAKKVTAKKVAAKAPVKKVAAKAPAKKVVGKSPAKAPAQKAGAKVAAASPATAPSKKVATKVASAPPAKAANKASNKAPVKGVVAAAEKKPAKPPVKKPAFVKPPVPGKKPVSKDGIVANKDFDLTFLRARRAQLLELRDQYLGQVAALDRERELLIEASGMGDDQFDEDGGEGDTLAVERERAKMLSDQDRQIVVDIEAALTRIEVGDYGYSVISTAPIPRERLEFIPWATELVSERVGGIGQR